MAAIGDYFELQSEDPNKMSGEFIRKKVGFEMANTHVDPDKLYNLMVTASYCETHPDLIRDYCRIGLITAAKQDGNDNLFFDDDAIYWLRQIRLLRLEGEVSQRGLQLIFDLRQQVEHLKRELRFQMES